MSKIPGVNNMVDTLQTFLDSRLSDFHTSIPGKIVSYSEATERAVVQPLVRVQRKINEKIVTIEPPQIENVPVMMLHTSQFKLKIPIKKGDGCEIRFSEVGIGNFLNGTGAIVNPDDISRFSLTDAYCTPGLWGSNLPSNTPTIELTEAGQLKFLTGVSSFVRGEDLYSVLNTFYTTVGAVVGGDPATNAAAINTISAAALVAQTGLSTILSTKIKGE